MAAQFWKANPPPLPTVTQPSSLPTHKRNGRKENVGEEGPGRVGPVLNLTILTENKAFNVRKVEMSIHQHMFKFFCNSQPLKHYEDQLQKTNFIECIWIICKFSLSFLKQLSLYVAQRDDKLIQLFLPQNARCSDCRRVPPYPPVCKFYIFLPSTQ